MEREHKQHTRRIRNLIFIFVITAILISVSTYAWFIGMRTVNVDKFQVKIAAAESLMLSLDGVTFNDTVDINSDNFADVFEGNTNTWGGEEGLIPMSSVGIINNAASRLELYEKASITPSPGGFRLISSEVQNKDPLAPEQDGYVAFDLFVMNISGNDYIEEENVLDEEAIYLTVDSEATVDPIGGQVGTGIENSVRVAFAQIGRVKAAIDRDANKDLIQGIACAGNDTGDVVVTGTCSRGAQIWEPNDVSHVTGAINWYKTACRPRTGAIIIDKESFNLDGQCNQLTDGLAYPTYAINSKIGAGDNVDVYDGAVYNSYEGSTKLEEFPTFTDTKKLLEGKARPEFMTLAANSITKVRVYIYIEGQDIDNYDFAQIGQAISIKFGFTKQQFTEDDTGYTGPNTNQGEGPDGVDKNPPVIVIDGFETAPRVISHTLGEEFTAPEATATDNVDSDVTVTLTNKVNVNVAGEYTLVYRSQDTAGNVATKTVKVIVQ